MPACSPVLLRGCLIAPAVLLGNNKPMPGGPSRCSLYPLTGQLELLSDAPAKADKRRLPGVEQSCMERCSPLIVLRCTCCKQPCTEIACMLQPDCRSSATLKCPQCACTYTAAVSRHCLPCWQARAASLHAQHAHIFCTLIFFDDCAGLKRLMRGSHPQKVPNAEPVRTCLVLPYWVEMQEVDPMTLELNLAVPDRMLGGLSRAVQSCRLNWP